MKWKIKRVYVDWLGNNEYSLSFKLVLASMMLGIEPKDFMLIK